MDIVMAHVAWQSRVSSDIIINSNWCAASQCNKAPDACVLVCVHTWGTSHALAAHTRPYTKPINFWRRIT